MTLELASAPEKRYYVGGFLLLERHVVLSRKRRPSWLADKLNAVGGKMNKGELPHDAMQRAFSEEAGARIQDWALDPILDYPQVRVYFLSARRFAFEVNVRSVTDERITVLPIEAVYQRNDLAPSLALALALADTLENSNVQRPVRLTGTPF